jgi:FAD/FMN-containing dehydrogenase
MTDIQDRIGVRAIEPGDPRYPYFSTRGFNRRFLPPNATVRPVVTAREAQLSVQQAVDAGARIAIRSGGHCQEQLVDHPDAQSLIDVSHLNQVRYDPEHNAFSVESGAMLGEVYKCLFGEFGVVVPGGTCPTVGIGGYVLGGGFGALCRKHGLVVDHLYGVEAVVVDASGQARTVLATRDPADPEHELWWGCTGSGGGTYGLVTRFLFRSPGAEGDPSSLLPRPPETSLVALVDWSWDGMTDNDFARLVRNHGDWHAEHAAPGDMYESLYSGITYNTRATGHISLSAQMDGTLPRAEEMMTAYIDALSAGVNIATSVRRRTTPFITTAFLSLYANSVSEVNRYKGKGAYLRRPYTAEQIEIMYRYLTREGQRGTIDVMSYGSRVNTVDPAATAAPQRDSILKAWLGCAWSDAAEDGRNVAWVREFYRDMYETTGGVPVSDAFTDGSYINYPDVDLADPRWNTSGVPWHELYFKQNYPRMQQVKAVYDPSDIFRHPLSVRLP